MERYVLIDTRDPFQYGNGRRYELAAALAGEAEDVSVYLVENAVLAARRDSAAARELETLAAGAQVVADDFSLRARAISDGELVSGVGVGTVDGLVDTLTEDGRKAVWL